MKEKRVEDYTVKTLSTRTNRAVTTIRHDIRKGAVKAFKVGGSVRIRYEDGERYAQGTEIVVQ